MRGYFCFGLEEIEKTKEISNMLFSEINYMNACLIFNGYNVGI